MKPKLLKIQATRTESFSARLDLSPAVNNMWHYHEELELIYIKEGEGTRFIGDKINSFTHGDVLLLGSNLPHYWRFESEYFQEDSKVPEVYVVHFKANFLGEAFLEAAENRGLKKLLENAKRGLTIKGKQLKSIVSLFSKLIEKEGQQRLLTFLQMLTEITESNTQAIASIGFNYDLNTKEQERMQAVYTYTLNNYKRKITLDEIAEVAKMSTHSFCKFFKSRSKKNYTDFVNEIRIGHACKLLMENKLMISQICFESGFNNFSSFHKCFKQFTSDSPLQYQKQFL